MSLRPRARKLLVDLWRNDIEAKISKKFEAMTECINDQAAFSELVFEMVEELELTKDDSQATDSEDQNDSDEAGDERSEDGSGFF